GKNLEAENFRHRGLLDLRGDQRPPAFCIQSGGNVGQDLDQVCSGPAARIEHEHAWISQAISQAHFRPQHSINSGHLVLDYFPRCIPDTEILPELGVECFQEWLVEVLDSVLFFELAEKNGPVDTIED